MIDDKDYENRLKELIQDVTEEKRSILQSKLVFRRAIYADGEKYKGLIGGNKREGYGFIQYNIQYHHY